MNILCPHCGKENVDNARFCNQCSAPLTQVCPRCNDIVSIRARFCQKCGATLTAQSATPAWGRTGRLQTASILANRYQIERKLGEGGMGAVYLARDKRLNGKLWAIKEMSDTAILDPQEHQQAIQAFRQEAEMLAALDQPNLPKVVDFFSEYGNQYLVMEYVQGETLQKRLEQSGRPMSEAQVLDFMHQMCNVLDYLHHQNPPIIFRDLKPSNIMIQPDGKLKLIDFGIARHFKPGKGQDTQAMGTPGYAAPEQYGKGQTDARSDIYALGATMHHMLTGIDPADKPFTFVPVRNVNPTVSPALAHVVARAVEMDPGNRWQSIREMRNAIHQTAIHGSVPFTIGQNVSTIQQVTAPAAVQARTIVPTTVLTSDPAMLPSVPVRPVPPPIPIPGSFAPVNSGATYASYDKRIIATLLDSLFSFFIYVLFIVVGAGLGDAGLGLMLLLGMFIIPIFYYWRPTANKGQTLGKKMMNIRIVDRHGNPPGWAGAFIRFLGIAIESGLMSFMIGFLGLLWPLWDRHNQTWHDKLAGTYVIDA